MNIKSVSALLAFGFLSACATYQYQAAQDPSKFYADKLGCETLYTQGFNIWGNKVYGNIYQEGAARDCMLAKGYQTAVN